MFEPWVLGPLQAYLTFHDEWHQLDQLYPCPIRDNHPLFCWTCGPGFYRSRRNNPALTHGCRPIGVRVIQSMMRAALRMSGVLGEPTEMPSVSRLVPPHSLRHAAATIALERGAPLHQVQAILRHTEIQTTMLCTHNKERITNVEEHRMPDFTAPPDGEPCEPSVQSPAGADL